MYRFLDSYVTFLVGDKQGHRLVPIFAATRAVRTLYASLSVLFRQFSQSDRQTSRQSIHQSIPHDRSCFISHEGLEGKGLRTTPTPTPTTTPTTTATTAGDLSHRYVRIVLDNGAVLSPRETRTEAAVVSSSRETKREA